MKPISPKQVTAILLLSPFALPVAALDNEVVPGSPNRMDCQTTKPPDKPFVPPSPFPSRPDNDRFYFGTKELWTAPFRNWTRKGRKEDRGYAVKLPWFSTDINDEDTRSARLLIRGRRLDGAAPALIVDRPNVGVLPEYKFFTSTLIFPTGGCWEITSTHNDTQITLVVLIDE